MLYECDLSVLEHREKGVTYVFLEFCPIRTAADLKARDASVASTRCSL